jgi:hypothetical protein
MIDVALLFARSYPIDLGVGTVHALSDGCLEEGIDLADFVGLDRISCFLGC